MIILKDSFYLIAAAAQGIIYIMSTLATSSVEEIAAIAPNGHNWFQLCIFKDRYMLNIKENQLK